MNKPFDLLTVGVAYVDINCTNFPFGEQGLLPETEIVGDDYEVVLGGSALNFARFCSSLGLKTAFVGKVGQDKMGSVLADLMQQSGVHPELISDAETTTNISLNLINGSGKSIMAVAGNAKHRLTSAEVESKITSLLPDAEYLMLGGLFKLNALLPVIEHVIAAAKDSDTKIIVDHGRVGAHVTDEQKSLVRGLVAHASYYFPSREEFCNLREVSNIEDGLAKVAGESSAVTVVKDGANGAVSSIDSRTVRVPAYPVEVINTIGAGDSFNAGFMAAIREGKSIEDSMRFACATAALKVSRRELPTREGVEAYLVSNERI